MTTTTTTANVTDPAPGTVRHGTAPAARAPIAQRQTLRRAVASEGIKMRSLRGTWIGLGSLILLLVGFGLLGAQFSGSGEGPGADGGATDPLSIVLVGANFAVLLAGVLGSLVGAREFGSRMIALTVAAVPRRWQIVVAKAAVLTALVVPAAVVAVFGAFFAGMAVLSAGGGATVSLTDDGVLRTLLGMAAYIDVIALLGLGLGILLRSVASSIGAIVAGILILPALAGSLLPDSWDAVLQFLPSSAAASFTAVQSAGSDVLDSGAGVLVLAAWVALALGGAVLAITRRDA